MGVAARHCKDWIAVSKVFASRFLASSSMTASCTPALLLAASSHEASSAVAFDCESHRKFAADEMARREAKVMEDMRTGMQAAADRQARQS